MVEPREEVRVAARALAERLRPLPAERSDAAPADALAAVNALLARAGAAVPESPLIGAMRPLESGSTLADLVTRLAALQRAITFV